MCFLCKWKQSNIEHKLLYQSGSSKKKMPRRNVQGLYEENAHVKGNRKEARRLEEHQTVRQVRPWGREWEKAGQMCLRFTKESSKTPSGSSWDKGDYQKQGAAHGKCGLSAKPRRFWKSSIWGPQSIMLHKVRKWWKHSLILSQLTSVINNCFLPHPFIAKPFSFLS